MKPTNPAFPDPEEITIQNEELLEKLQNLQDRFDFIVKLIFKQPEIFNAWYHCKVHSAPITIISRQISLTPYKVKRRIEVAENIVRNFQQTLHPIDD